MKKLSAGSPRTKFTVAASACIWTIAIATSAGAAQLKEARVTQVVNDVKLLLQQAAPRPAAISDLVRYGAAVRTGTQSRSELTFADLTITRLGANTIFSFNEGTREMNLIDGALLFQVPKGSGGATIKTVGVTAAITGTTGIGEFHPATTSNPHLFSKWLCLEGKIRLYLPNGQSVELGPGKMVTTDGNSFSKVLDFDIARLVSTSLFFTGFDQPLASMNLIMLESQNQLASVLLASSPLNNPLDPTRIVNVINQAIVAEEAQTSPSESPTPPITPTPPVTPTPPPPTPSKFGTPSVISSPDPYLITNGTIITTDPSITTNGVTDYGKIYRGATDDGAFTLWAFGSTSAVDTAFGIDDVFFADPNHLPIAIFKFQSLSLIGNPTIDLSNGGTTKLGLIGVDGITSGPPGGILTFTGLDLLVLATVNGSINLTSDVSFQDLSELAMYARGAGSDLTLDSPISNIGTLQLAGEDSIQLTNPGTMSVGEFDAITGGGDLTLQIGGSLLLNGKVRLDAIVLPGATITSGANLTLNVTGDYTNSSATEFSRLAITNQGHIVTGGNISADITGNLTATGLGSATESPEPGDFVALVQNTNALIDNGGNLTLTVNGNVNVNGLAAYVQNYDGTANPAGHIGTGGNIDIEIGGDLTANSYVDVVLGNRGGGMIDSGGNLTFNVSGALNIGVDAFTPGFSAEFIISTRYDDIGGNTTPSFIGSDVSLFVHAASVDMAGGLFGSGISNRGGSVIDGNATATWDVPGDVTIQGTDIAPAISGASWWILNDIPSDHQFTPPGAGTIHGDATLTLNIGGDLTIAGDASMFIDNHRNFGAVTSSGGTIDSDATLNITAANISVGGELDVEIDNFISGSSSGTGGSIGGNATINLTLSGSLTTTGSDPNSVSPGDAFFDILNESLVGGSPGGFIGGDATININAGSISTAGIFDATINNSGGGTIGGNANVAVNVTNDVTVLGGVTLQILNGNGGHIVTGADVLYSVGGSTSTTDLIEYIDDSNGGVIDNGGNITLHTVGPVMLDGGLVLEVDNFNGGTINNGANVTAHFVGDVTDTVGEFHSLNWYVINGSGFFTPTATGGTIGTGGNINVTFDGNASTTGTSTTGSIAAEIFNGAGGSIGTGGNISMTVGGNLTVGPLFLITENQGGNIGTGGNMTLDVAGDITTQGDANFLIFNNDNGSGPGTMESNATINVSAANISTGGSLFDNIFNDGGAIGENALINTDVSGAISTQADAVFQIANNDGGQIGGSATIDVSAASISSQAGGLFVSIFNQLGSVSGNAAIQVSLSGDIATLNGGTFQIWNFGVGPPAGTIEGDATISVTAANFSAPTGSLISEILNQNVGFIGGNAIMNFDVSGNINTGNAEFIIDNIGGAIGQDARISLTATNISIGGSLDVTIDNNTNGGTIGAAAVIDMNPSGTVMVTNDATVQILNSGLEGSAAINFNGGAYSVGGTFLTQMLNNGTIAFNNATVAADVLKAGVFGTNGVLNIGGGILSADTTLKLYASGSNGQLNFISNVTLGGNSAKILAANSVTIFDNVVVTIGGPNPADVYTDNANYTGFGGNKSTTGTFAGAGANDPQPLDNAPPFGPASAAKITTGGNIPHAMRISPRPPSTVTTGGNISDTRRASTAINVSSSNELLSLLDGAAPGPGGKITVPPSNSTSNSRNSNRTDIAHRLNAGNRLNVNRRAMDMRTASSSVIRRSPQ